jgi:hypothetical protein
MVEIKSTIAATAAEWAVSTRILREYQLGLETDTGKTKRGDGVSRYPDLAYIPGGGGGGNWGDIGGDIADQADLQAALATKITGDGVSKIIVSPTEPPAPDPGTIWIQL